jgi:uncharacterized protein (DUF302 family)
MNTFKSICVGAITGFALLLNGAASAADGLVTVESAHSVKATVDKLESVLKSKGMKVFARIDHTAGAASVDMEIRPTEVLLFGNPKVGTPLMICAQSVAIDLPQKMLVWEAEDGKVYLGYNDPAYLKSRHAVEGCDKVLGKVSGALGNFAAAAAAK